MISIKLQRLRPGAKKALAHKVFMRGGEMQYWYEQAIEKPEKTNFVLAIAFDEDIPVAAIMVKDGLDVNIYVKSAYRRQGIGGRLLAHIKRYRGLSADKLKAGLGVRGSKSFWKKKEVELFSWYQPPKKLDFSKYYPSMYPVNASPSSSTNDPYMAWPYNPGVDV